MKQSLREIPAVNLIQNHDEFSHLIDEYQISFQKLTNFAKQEVEYLRDIVKNGKWEGNFSRDLAISYILNQLSKRVKWNQEYNLRNVINATGVIIHTNLGRSRLSESAIEQMLKAAKSYTNLEYNIETGQRGSRHAIIEEILCNVTGAEAAMVVNNNAAAVFLILSCFAKGKEVIVSRGELVEIGGSFRISSIMEESGAILKEVGTTNKTHIKDYENAINNETVMLMKVHTSNFKVIGFTEAVTTKELTHITKKHDGLIVYEDLGSGSLYNFHEYQIGEEPIVTDVLKAGTHLVSFSGDKLLGGPQAGIIVGKKALIKRLKSNQLARVLRVDKFTLAALEATLHDYIDKTANKNIPTVRDILFPIEQIEMKAQKFIEHCRNVKHNFIFKMDHDYSKVGGGTMPDVSLPTIVVKCRHPLFSVNELVTMFRASHTPVIVRVKEEHVLLDFRTIAEAEISELIIAIMEIEGKTEVS